MLTVTFTGVAGLVGWGVTSEAWALFLIPFVVLLPSLWFIASQLTSTIRIATYIEAYIEPNVTGMGWESRLSIARDSCRLPDRRYTLSTSMLYGLVGAACVVLAWVYGLRDASVTRIVVLGAGSVLLLGLTAVLSVRVHETMTPEFRDGYLKMWHDCLGDEENEEPFGG